MFLWFFEDKFVIDNCDWGTSKLSMLRKQNILHWLEYRDIRTNLIVNIHCPTAKTIPWIFQSLIKNLERFLNTKWDRLLNVVSCSNDIFNLGLCLTLVNSIILEDHMLFYRMLLTGSYNGDFTACAQAIGGNIWLEYTTVHSYNGIRIDTLSSYILKPLETRPVPQF